MGRPKQKSNPRKLSSFLKRIDFQSPKNRFVIFLLAFALIGGGYLAYRSFAYTTSSGPFTPMYLIKTKNTPGCKVEVHRAKGDSNYQNPDIHSQSWFSCGDADNGIWQSVNGDLYFIKTKNTSSGRIEVHSATKVSNYTEGVHYATALAVGENANGTFQMVGKDLYFIKTRNTGGTIEVHAVSAASNYQTFIIHSATAFGLADADNGSWRMYNSDLALVKTKNTPGGKVELHVVTRASNYKVFSVHAATVFGNADNANGTFWVVDANGDGAPDLGFVKKINTGSGKVEMFFAEAPNYGVLAVATPTWFSPTDANNGTWYIDNQVLKPAPAPTSTPAPAPAPTPAKTGYICVGTTVVTVASRDACKALLTYGSNGNAAYVYAQMIASDQANAGGPASTAPVPGQPTPSTPAPPTPAANPCPSGGPQIQEGAQGGAVAALTSCLGNLGYWIRETTDFNSVVTGMVKDFQGNRGLACDGVVGPQTYGSLGQAGATGWKRPGTAACTTSTPAGPTTPTNPTTPGPGPKGTCHIWYRYVMSYVPEGIPEYLDAHGGLDSGVFMPQDLCYARAVYFPGAGLSDAQKAFYKLDHIDWPQTGSPIWSR